MAQMLLRLAARHQVALLYLRAKDEPPLDQELHQRCAWTEQVTRPTVGRGWGGVWRWRVRLLGALLCGKPTWAALWAVPAFGARVRAAIDAWHPDIVQIEYHIMAQYVYAMPPNSAPRLLVEYEPGVRSAPFPGQSKEGLGRAVYALDRWAWRRYERAIMAKVRGVVVFTHQDRCALEPLARKTPITCIPLGAECPARAFDPLGGEPPTLLFVGNLKHPPNLDAAFWLAGELFPRIQAHLPDARLCIVGAQPPEALQKMAHEQITITGYVADVAPYLDNAAVVVAPLRQGGGMRVKVLETLMAGKALVASPLAVEGLEIEHGEQALLAETEEQFVDAIVWLITHPEERALLASRARIWASEHLSWGKSIAAYEALYDRLRGHRAARLADDPRAEAAVEAPAAMPNRVTGERPHE